MHAKHHAGLRRCRRDPELLMVPCQEVAAALLHFKLALPALDILELVKRKPSLLRDKVLGSAIA